MRYPSLPLKRRFSPKRRSPFPDWNSPTRGNMPVGWKNPRSPWRKSPWLEEETSLREKKSPYEEIAASGRKKHLQGACEVWYPTKDSFIWRTLLQQRDSETRQYKPEQFLSEMSPPPSLRWVNYELSERAWQLPLSPPCERKLLNFPWVIGKHAEQYFDLFFIFCATNGSIHRTRLVRPLIEFDKIGLSFPILWFWCSPPSMMMNCHDSVLKMEIKKCCLSSFVWLLSNIMLQ